MKTVGKQLEEGRLGKKWTPQMASRETKIRVDRLIDLESDNFSNFTSPTYARGFVRTYARALNLDEYRLLRQLDQKLPEWDGTLLTDSGVVYVPQPANLPQITPTGNKWGGAILHGICVVVFGFFIFIAYENYKLYRENPPTAENQTVDQTPAPVATPTAAPNAPVAALPVNPTDLPPGVLPAKAVDTTELAGGTVVTPAPSPAPATTDPAPVADPNATVVAPTVTTTTPQPLDLSNIPTAPAVTEAPVAPTTAPAAPTPAPDTTSTTPPATPTADTTPPLAAKAIAVDPAELQHEMALQSQASPTPDPATVTPAPTNSKPLSLTAKGDCHVTIYEVDKNNKSQVIYSNTLHAGDSSIDFEGDRFTIKLSDPAMVDISVNDAPYAHSQDHSPETLSVKVHDHHIYN